jgi:hypothetical protein
MDSKCIESATQKFLSSGGSITKCPVGYAMSQDYKVPNEDDVILLKLNLEMKKKDRSKYERKK